jgi:hypothetical protein
MNGSIGAFSVIVLLAGHSAARAQDAVRPMPPTDLRVVFDERSPSAATNAVRQVIPLADQVYISDVLDEMSPVNLRALAAGVMTPEDFGLVMSPTLTDRQWRGLVVAYAQAALLDLDRANDRWWQLVMFGFGAAAGMLTAVLGVMLTHRLAR